MYETTDQGAEGGRGHHRRLKRGELSAARRVPPRIRGAQGGQGAGVRAARAGGPGEEEGGHAAALPRFRLHRGRLGVVAGGPDQASGEPDQVFGLRFGVVFFVLFTIFFFILGGVDFHHVNLFSSRRR